MIYMQKARNRIERVEQPMKIKKTRRVSRKALGASPQRAKKKPTPLANPQTAAEKVLAAHLVEGTLQTGTTAALRMDQTLTQDATGTMAWLQFEALQITRVRTQLSLSYVDHNTLQTGFENADDHAFLQSAAAKFGAIFSRPGNGICHQVHLERFGKPGATLLGSDSHTPTGGGLGMIAIGAGGLDVAAAMGGAPFYLTVPAIMNIVLTGKLHPRVSAKDVVLEVLRRLTVKGGVGKILEYSGPGLVSLSVPERATITNMGAETGATTSLFPADAVTKAFLAYQGRVRDFSPLSADPGAVYAGGEMQINLSDLEPMAAQPHSPDAVAPIKALRGLRVQQVVIGSCTNSSLADLVAVAGMLSGKKVHPEVSLVISPGSQQVLTALAKNGALQALIAAGARTLEPACGACMGQAPASDAVTLRTFNRNFKGRSGTPNARVYLVSPETAAAAALTGEVTDPRTFRSSTKFVLPAKADVVDSLLVYPPKHPDKVAIVRGPNIAPLPQFSALPETDAGKVLLKTGDNITTDDIMPAGAKILPLRSNIPAIARHVFAGLDPEFWQRAQAAKGGYIVGGENYGQGSSREHAALAPRYLGVRAVLVKSFARIHLANLINFGILPLTFIQAADYEKVTAGDSLTLPDLKKRLVAGESVKVANVTQGTSWEMQIALSPRQLEILLAGGFLNWLKKSVAISQV
jgi:aconitate hydratase